MGNELAIIPVSDMQIMARAVVTSGLWGIKTEAQALALMLVAQAEGLHPATAARDYNIIQGRPALKADAMLARFQAAGGVVEWQEMTDSRVAGMFSHPHSCPKPVLIDWDMQRARQAQLGGKEMWSKYPRQMLRARVISEGIRAVYPGAVSGVYTPEEVADFTVEEQPQPAATYTLDRPSEPTGEVYAPAPVLVRCQVKSVVERTSRAGNPYRDVTMTTELGGSDHYLYFGKTISAGFTGPLDCELGMTDKGKPVIQHAHLPKVDAPPADDGDMQPPQDYLPLSESLSKGD